LLIAILKHGRDVAGHARHGAGAYAFDAGLLDRLEHRATVLALRTIAVVDVIVVIGEAHGEGIGDAAGDGDFLRIELDRDLRKLDLLALQAGSFGTETDRELGFSGDGLHRQGKDATELACRSFAVLGHGPSASHDKATCAGDSGSSSPKHR